MKTAGVLTTLALLVVLVGSDVRRVSSAELRPGLRSVRNRTHPTPGRWLWTRASVLLLALVATGLMLPVLWGLLT